MTNDRFKEIATVADDILALIRKTDITPAEAMMAVAMVLVTACEAMGMKSDEAVKGMRRVAETAVGLYQDRHTN
jgi:hypothetical protein